jgi:hypothetical protein
MKSALSLSNINIADNVSQATTKATAVVETHQGPYYAVYLEANRTKDLPPPSPLFVKSLNLPDCPTCVSVEIQSDLCIMRPLHHVDDLGSYYSNSCFYCLSPVLYLVINILMVEMFERFHFIAFAIP